MIIKKVKKTKNQYLHTNGFWVRDFTNPEAIPVDLNHTFNSDELSMVVENEAFNSIKHNARIGSTPLKFEQIVIISDGFAFNQKQEELTKLPSNVAILATNKSLLLYNHFKKKPINLYVVNNPYDTCIGNLPVKTNFYPSCIMSYKTNQSFVTQYKNGNKLFYETTPVNTVTARKDIIAIDDYRNPICAAIALSYHFNVKKLLLFCTDKSFADKREASVKLDNGLYTYEQNLVADSIIDAQLYWLKTKGIEIGNYSMGKGYINSTYIQTESEMLNFFKMEQK